MNDFEGKPCPECHVSVGHLHRLGCDVEQCPYCGLQLLLCLCDTVVQFKGVPDDDRIPWMGHWPGDRECEHLGWFCKQDPVKGGWTPCCADDPDGIPDINRLRTEAKWDRWQQEFITRHL